VTVERSKGKPRPRPVRTDRKPRTKAAELAAPFKDPRTGQFTAGNPGGRLRQVAALGKQEAESLLKLAPEAVAPFLRPHLAAAQDHAQELVDGLPAATAELVALAGDEAKARLMTSACLTEGARAECTPPEARAWREEARSWMREVRQVVLTRKAVARELGELPPDPEAFTRAAIEARKPRPAP
jgi:hypothetical protein